MKRGLVPCNRLAMSAASKQGNFRFPPLPDVRLAAASGIVTEALTM